MSKSGKSLLAWAAAGFVGLTTAFTILAARFEPAIRENTFVGDIPIGGLSPDAAKRKLRIWWERAKREELTFESDLLKVLPRPKSPGKMGITVDDAASVDAAPMTGFRGYLAGMLSLRSSARQTVPVRFKYLGANFEELKRFVADNAGSPSPARVRFVDGRIERTPEVGGYILDEKALPSRLMAALHADRVVDLPLIQGPKRVPDEALDQIKDIVTEFSTTFSTGKVNRCSNIKLAASKLDGVILMPGETMSFNNTVGPRTVETGYKLAGVYANGKQDVGIGGGICQVSTTLYNAALLSNLKIRRRSNHSMPVPYVPLGRDATVAYRSIDLQIQNPYETPIAITSAYAPGRLTFRVLGIKDTALKIEIVASGHTSRPTAVEQVVDPSLPAGTTKVIEEGSSGQTVNTYRLVYRDGQLVERQPLGQSNYRGAVRIITVGSKSAARKPDGAERL